MGFSGPELLDRFYYTETIILKNAFVNDESKRVFTKYFDSQSSQNQRAIDDIKNPKNQQVIVAKGKKISKASIRKIQEAEIQEIPTSVDDILGRFALNDVVGADGEVIVHSNQPVTKEILEQLIDNKIEEVTLLFIGNKTIGTSFRNTLAADKVDNPQEAMIEIYKKMKPGDPPTLEVAKNLLKNMITLWFS